MGLSDDLREKVRTVFASAWTTRNGTVIPSDTDLKLTNDAVLLKGTCLYADIAGSTALVDNQTPEFSSEVYKSYLHCASKLITAHGGVITAFDGDRVMGVFIGDSKNTSAVKCAMKIYWSVLNIINPAIATQYGVSKYSMKHGVGIDQSDLMVSRTGIRGSNDLVWIGRAGNHAAKLSAIRDGNYYTWISKEVYDNMNDEVKFSNGTNMWEQRSWTAQGGKTIYRSSWHWRVD